MKKFTLTSQHVTAIVCASFLLFWVLSIGLLTQSCKLLPEEPTQIIQKTDKYYAVIKTIVTDPAIYALLSPEQLKDIHEVDETYKKIRKIAANLEESQAVVRTMAQCGVDICDLLDELNVDDGEKQKEIAALRIALKMFMATLVEPPLELVE